MNERLYSTWPNRVVSEEEWYSLTSNRACKDVGHETIGYICHLHTRRCLVSRIICHLLPADSTGYLEVPGAMSLVDYNGSKC